MPAHNRGYRRARTTGSRTLPAIAAALPPEAGKAGQATGGRRTSRFSWDEVDVSLIQLLLIAAYQDDKQDEEVDEVRKLTDRGLRFNATRVLGSPLQVKHMNSVTDVLRSEWLPAVTKEKLIAFAKDVQLGLTGPDRTAQFSSKRECVEFLQRRRKTLNFKAQLRKFFLKEHRTVTVTIRPAVIRELRDVEPIELLGAGRPDHREPFDHQRQAWTALTELERASEPRAGLMVFPTGAGKTYTMVHWLLSRMAARPELRVLWVADRRELVDQAAATFVELAQTMKPRFSRRLRAVHGNAGLPSSLADLELGVAVVTRQSLLASFNGIGRMRLEALLSKPTVVVVDEAHHAVAPTYDRLLTEINKAKDVMVVGLTATPWPAGYGAIAALRKRFPYALGEAGIGDLIGLGVLARPVFHTVRTNVSVSLDAADLAWAVGHDLPPSVLRKLDQEGRNHSILQAWWDRRNEWGKTLLFAVDTRHADTLGAMFARKGARVKVLHYQTNEPGVLDWFRAQTGPAVLISVGMLTEGVDVPDARTAFLARPTSSRILMRQMVGRVLRGPVAGGDTLANIVDVHDQWDNNLEVLSPVEIPVLGEPPREASKPNHALPAVRDERTGDLIPPDVLHRIIRQINERLYGTKISVGLASSMLTGFYQLDLMNVPVFEHTAQAWSELIDARLQGHALPVRYPIDMFGDLPIPRPTPYDVRSVLNYIDGQADAPPFQEARAAMSLRAVALSLLDKGAMTAEERVKRIREDYDNTLAKLFFPTFQAFIEAVDREVLALTWPGEDIQLDPENVPPRSPANGPGLPRLRQIADRDLKVALANVAARGRLLLADEPEYTGRLRSQELPTIDWTRKPSTGAWAYWTPRISGRGKGRTSIRVNSVLRAPRTQIPDAPLEFLLWHELCHHLTPNQGHDAEFRRLESLWPDAHLHDHFIDDLPRTYDIPATVAAARGPGNPRCPRRREPTAASEHPDNWSRRG